MKSEMASKIVTWSPVAATLAAISQVPWYDISMRTISLLIALSSAWVIMRAVWNFLGKYRSMLTGIRELVISMPVFISEVRSGMRLLSAMQRAFQDASNVMTFESKHNGDWIWTSDSLEKFINVQSFELEGRNWLSQIHPAQRDQVEHEWDSCLKSRRTFDVTIDLKNSKRIRIVASMVDDETGTYVGHCHDSN